MDLGLSRLKWGFAYVAGGTVAAMSAHRLGLDIFDAHTEDGPDGPTPGSRVVAVRVRAGAFVDSVEFVFSDGYVSHYGGGGGNEQVEFSVGPDEFIAGVKGRSGAYVDSIRFVTSAGRESPRYGSNGGDKAYEFSSGAPIGGLSASVSARGWLARVAGVWTCDDVTVPPAVAAETRRRRRAVQQSLVSRHVAHVRFRWTAMLVGAALLAGLAGRAGLPLATTWVKQGPMPLEDWLVGSGSRTVHAASSSSTWGGRGFTFLPAAHAEDYRKLHAAVGEAAATVGCFTQVPDQPPAYASIDASSGGVGRPTWQASAPWRESSFMGFLPVERQWLLLPIARIESGNEHLQGGSQRSEGDGNAIGNDSIGDSKDVAQVSAALQHHFRATLVLATKVGTSWQDGGRVHAFALRLALVLHAAMSKGLGDNQGIGAWLAAMRRACAESNAVMVMGDDSSSSSSATTTSESSSRGDRFLRVGVLRQLQPKHYGSESDDNSGTMPPFFVDTSVNPLLLLALLTMAASVGCAAIVKLLLLHRGGATHDPCLSCLVAYVNLREESRGVAALLKQLDAEVADALGHGGVNSTMPTPSDNSNASSNSTGDGNGTSSTASSAAAATVERAPDVHWANCRIIVTQRWLVVLRPRGMDAVRVEDVRIVTPPRLVLRHSGSERVECVQLDIRREIHATSAATTFRLEVPREGFDGLQRAAVGRRRVRALVNIKKSYRHGLAAQERTFLPHLSAVADGSAADSERNESLQLVACLGDCGAMANVRVTKQCITCEERDGCACEPAWCANCLFAWWVEKNTTRLDTGEPPARKWQARCPTCRVFFCLDDVVLVGPLNASATSAANQEPAAPSSRPVAPTTHTPRQEDAAQAPLSSSSPQSAPSTAPLADEETSTTVPAAEISNEEEEEHMAEAIRMSPQEHSAAAGRLSSFHESTAARQPSVTTIGVDAASEGTTGGAPSPGSANELRQRRLKRFETP